MSEHRKLHPITYLSKIFKVVKDNILTLVFALFLVMKNGFKFEDIGDLIFPGILLLSAVIGIVIAVVEAVTTTYWIEDDKLFVKSGWLSVTTKELYIGRIQSIEATRNIVNQVFGGVILEVKTPGEGVKLDTISQTSAEALTHYLETRKQNLAEGTETVEHDQLKPSFEVYYQLKLKDIMLMSVTSGAMGTVLAVVFGLYTQIDEVLNISERLKPLQNQVAGSWLSIAVAVVSILVISYVIGIFVTALKYFNYELTYDGERLKIRHGLFEVKERIIVVKQIQAVEENKSFLRQWLGFTSFSAIITSDSAIESEEENIFGKVDILPFVTRKEGKKVMTQLVPDYYYNEVNRVIPLRSFRRYFQFSWLFIIIVTGLVQYYLFDKAWVAGLVFLAITFVSAWMRYKHSGYIIRNNQITVRETGLFSSTIYQLQEDKLISIHVKDHYFLKKAQLATVELRVSAGSIFTTATLHLMDRQDAEAIYDWFMQKEVRQYEES
ncbi:PH domain-containing protein [Macrococcus carouselicus]|nr:PH domain-containing protein [Macrococcus carouselicus]